ncbi:hypothetical protein GCM10011352_01630 [Marinobacterium zhoushanense]|uniref:Uncharacterized protein n=1 Tax=Marinobacterium zhoushanense TaxID=1679163 RepID=A0ABQ1JYQ6_9GAMM|nr:hypothetical protein [Marinobacterium zhoushanense]GGB79653.1 hypothetical protein GCM10011352_01630 [Marinobacterium zhoushanense]
MFMPAQKDDAVTASGCKLSHPKMELVYQEYDRSVCSSGMDGKACLLIYGIVIPAGSFVVSGSIVVSNNIISWFEYQGICEESNLNRTLTIFTDSDDQDYD